MAPPNRGAARRSEAYTEEYRELGKAGRKTGTLLPDLGARDEHGMAPLDKLFGDESPDNQTPNAGDDKTQGAMDMDLEDDIGPGPLSIIKGAHKLLPRGTSPRKTNMQSPALRNPLLGRSSSPVRGTIVDSDPVDEASPPQRAGSVARKLNYPNGARAKASRANGTQSNGTKRAPQIVEDDEEEDEDDADMPGQDDSDGEDDSMQMVGGDDTIDSVEEVEEDEEAVESPPPVKAKPGRRGRPAKNKKPSPEPEPESASESEPEALPVFDEPTVDEDEDVSMTPEPEPAPKPALAGKKRGRPAATKVASAEKPAMKKQAPLEKPAAKKQAPAEKVAPKKRGRPSKKSLEAQKEQEESVTELEETTVAEEEEEEEEEDPRPSKRSRVTEKAPKPATKPPPKAAGRRGRPKATPAMRAPSPEAEPEQQQPEPTPEPTSEPVKPKVRGKGKAPAAEIEASKKAPVAKKGRGRPSKANVGEDSVLETVQKGPPLPKSRGLYSVKREGADSIHTTRSGRHSYAPLHYWRNERVLYNSENDVWEDSVNRGHEKFVLPSTKGVVRIEEEPVEQKRRARSSKPRAKSQAAASNEPKQHREPPEPWETGEGRIEGETIVWDPDYEFNPPAPDEPVSFEINQLAMSSDAIQTRNVRDATFRFTKLLSMPFFGSGIVDLPPGAEKKPKNSRKNHMTFFVHYGKVLVTVNETQFRISTGGYWNVPRGNYYNIVNDYDQPARLFFTQGCEMLIAEPDGRSVLEAPGMDTTVGI
ncbi:cupin domain-containing protein [Plectosphaerella plurivora]|uniref:CENP-C homolog n=1 Tax=Plectosphaerella plurivora TaxID=936078 RepID=A0A9P8VLH4_9PEZI|nr:cupin domain-containing protein [Plectosphaerella plurivora]